MARIAKVISVFVVVVWCDEYFSIVVVWVDLSLNGFFWGVGVGGGGLCGRMHEEGMKKDGGFEV